MAALRLAYSPFWNALNSTHSTVTPSTVACTDRMASDSAPSSAMPSVQRCRRPAIRPSAYLRVVRSDSAPATGVARPEAIAPAPLTTARATILWCGVMCWSWSGRSTCSGV